MKCIFGFISYFLSRFFEKFFLDSFKCQETKSCPKFLARKDLFYFLANLVKGSLNLAQLQNHALKSRLKEILCFFSSFGAGFIV
jgi:hypothetical protein